MLLGGDARVGAGRVDERDEREAVAVGELHRPHRLPVALGIGHAEVADGALLQVAALLVAHEGDRPPVERADAGDDRVVVQPAAVAVELEPVVEDPLDVVQRVRALLVPGELDGAPDLLVRRVRLEPLELPLQALELGREPRSPQELDAGELRQSVAQAELGFLAHLPAPNRRRSRESVARSSPRGTTASTWPKRKFDSARPKSSGSFSRVVCATTRGPANDVSAPGSARITSPRLAKLAVTPPVVGCASTEISTPPASWRSPDGDHGLRQLHQREDALLHAGATRRRHGDQRAAVLGRPLAGAGEPLADDAPHRAAHEREVHRGDPARMALDRRAAGEDRVAEARPELRLGEALDVRPEVEELERVGRAQVAVLLLERAGVGKLRDTLARADRKVMTALRADAEVLGELVVAIVRSAARARVRVPAAAVAAGRVGLLVLDRDVDVPGGGHLGHLSAGPSEPGRGGEPRRGSRGRRPARARCSPMPATRALLATSSSSRSTSSSRGRPAPA